MHVGVLCAHMAAPPHLLSRPAPSWHAVCPPPFALLCMLRCVCRSARAGRLGDGGVDVWQRRRRAALQRSPGVHATAPTRHSRHASDGRIPCSAGRSGTQAVATGRLGPQSPAGLHERRWPGSQARPNLNAGVLLLPHAMLCCACGNALCLGRIDPVSPSIIGFACTAVRVQRQLLVPCA